MTSHLSYLYTGHSQTVSILLLFTMLSKQIQQKKAIVAPPQANIPHVKRASWLIWLFVVVMGGVGFLLAPNDLAAGNYTARIQISAPQFKGDALFPITIGDEAGGETTFTTRAGKYRLVVQGAAHIPYQLDQQIAYRLKIIDNDDQSLLIALDDATSMLIGDDYRQTLPPASQDEEWLYFSMRPPYRAKITTALLFAVAALWLTELIPLAAGAMLIPVVLVVADVADAKTALQAFAHPIIFLFIAGFLIAEGMQRSGLDRRIALTLLSRASLQPARLMLTMMGLTAFLSMWMSNTASVAIMIPIAFAVLKKIPQDAGNTGFRRALILGVAYAATVGGVGSAIGTPANILAMTFLNEFSDATFTFVDWFGFGLPFVIMMIPLIWLYLLLTFRVRLKNVGDQFSHDIYHQELNELGALCRQEQILLLTMTVVVALWLTEQWHHIPTAIVALAGAIFLFAIGGIREEDLGTINWNALLAFGGGLAIGSILVQTGISNWIALHLLEMANWSPYLIILTIAILTLVTGAFISNTACAAMFIPLAIPLAQYLRIDPHLLAAVVAIASSIDFALIVGTPPTMMAYSTGLFSPSEIFQRGIWLDLMGVLLLSLGAIWIWGWLGMVSLP